MWNQYKNLYFSEAGKLSGILRESLISKKKVSYPYGTQDWSGVWLYSKNNLNWKKNNFDSACFHKSYEIKKKPKFKISKTIILNIFSSERNNFYRFGNFSPVTVFR